MAKLFKLTPVPEERPRFTFGNWGDWVEKLNPPVAPPELERQPLDEHKIWLNALLVDTNTNKS